MIISTQDFHTFVLALIISELLKFKICDLKKKSVKVTGYNFRNSVANVKFYKWILFLFFIFAKVISVLAIVTHRHT